MNALKKLLKFMPSAEDEESEMKREGELHYACFLGDTEMLVRGLNGLETEEDINDLDSRGQTPLLLAVHKGHTKIVELLLKHGADPNITCTKSPKLAPLHRAASRDVVELLIAHGADIEAQADNGDTPLHRATRFDIGDVAKYLVEKKANVNATNKFQMTPMHVACEHMYNNEDFVMDMAQVLIHAGLDVNCRDLLGKTALHYLAASSAMFKVHYFFISNGAKVDIEDNIGYHAVHYLLKSIPAISKEFPDTLRLYLSQASAANLVDFQGRSTLHYLAEEGNEELIKIAIDQGGDVNLGDNAGRTPLHCASNKPNNAIVVKILMMNGADIDSADDWGRTALMTSVDNKNKPFAEALMKNGAAVNAADRVGNTALHIACYGDSPELVDILIKGNADVQSRDANRTTPLHAAAYTGGLECVEFLIDAGADRAAIDSDLKSPFQIAEIQEHLHLLCALTNDQTEKINTAVKLTNLGNELMSIESVLDMVENEQIVRKADDSEGIVSGLLLSSAKGRGADTSEAHEIQVIIENVITEIAKALVKLDSNFQCTILHAGSTSEGTKTKCPNEFDFMLCLEKLSELVEPDFAKADTKNVVGFTVSLGGNENDGKKSDDPEPLDQLVSVSDYAFLKVKDSESAVPFRPLLTMSGPFELQTIPCCSMYKGFSDIISKIIFSKDFPKDPRLTPLEVTLEPAVEFRWHGSRYKDLNIGVDLVPAIRLARWPDRMKKDSKLLLPGMLKRACLAVPKMTSAEDEALWRCSLALIETNIFRLLRPQIRNSYIACKCMISSDILPLIDFGENEDVMGAYKLKHPELTEEEESDMTFHEGVESVVPSYVIKMTFLSVLEQRVENYGLDFVYDINKIDELHEKTTGTTAFDNDISAKGQRDEHDDDSCTGRYVEASHQNVDSDIDKYATDTEVKVKGEWYGPALTMYTAQRNTDFDMTIVRDVFAECEKRLEDQFVPSVFNPNHNVLGNRLLSGDVEKALVFVRIINTLLQ